MAEFPREVKVEVRANWAVVKPGDTLVVAINSPYGRISEQDAEDIRERLQANLPGVRIVPVAASALLVYRPDK